MSEIDKYVITGGRQGRERLRVLGRVMEPTTKAFIERMSLRGDESCLDVGCGGGDATLILAAAVPQGNVTGVDFDEHKIAIAREEAKALGINNVIFMTRDVTAAEPSQDTYDMIYSRFVLTHLADPALMLRQLHERVVPGGTIAIEDIDFAGHVCFPPSPAFDRYVELYAAAARASGGDPLIGPRLPQLLEAAGFTDVDVAIAQPAGVRGDVKHVAALTLEAVTDSIVKHGLESEAKVGNTVAELVRLAEDGSTMMSVARVFQCTARRRLA